MVEDALRHYDEFSQTERRKYGQMLRLQRLAEDPPKLLALAAA